MLLSTSQFLKDGTKLLQVLAPWTFQLSIQESHIYILYISIYFILLYISSPNKTSPGSASASIISGVIVFPSTSTGLLVSVSSFIHLPLQRRRHHLKVFNDVFNNASHCTKYHIGDKICFSLSFMFLKELSVHKTDRQLLKWVFLVVGKYSCKVFEMCLAAYLYRRVEKIGHELVGKYLQ